MLADLISKLGCWAQDQHEDVPADDRQRYARGFGAGIKHHHLAWSISVRKVVKIPIIGCGGIVRGRRTGRVMLAAPAVDDRISTSFRNPSGMIAITKRRRGT